MSATDHVVWNRSGLRGSTNFYYARTFGDKNFYCELRTSPFWFKLDIFSHEGEGLKHVATYLDHKLTNQMIDALRDCLSPRAFLEAQKACFELI